MLSAMARWCAQRRIGPGVAARPAGERHKLVVELDRPARRASNASQLAKRCRIHGTTGEAPIARFERDEAHRLKPLGGRTLFGSLRELSRVVGNDCAVEIDTNSYSVPWRLIGELVAVTVAAGEMRIRHGVHEVAVAS
jgi:hypothetical protein